MKRLKQIVFFIAIAIPPTLAGAITDNEYKELRTWTLGPGGPPSARWGDVNCSVWSGIYPDCKHPGVDYGTGGKAIDINSVGDGTVTGTGGPTGKVCIYNSKRDKTLCYLHLSTISVKTGDSVKKGKKIGKSGSKGVSAVHLHFEARSGKKSSAAAKYSDSINPYDAAKSVR